MGQTIRRSSTTLCCKRIKTLRRHLLLFNEWENADISCDRSQRSCWDSFYYCSTLLDSWLLSFGIARRGMWWNVGTEAGYAAKGRVTVGVQNSQHMKSTRSDLKVRPSKVTVWRTAVGCGGNGCGSVTTMDWETRSCKIKVDSVKLGWLKRANQNLCSDPLIALSVVDTLCVLLSCFGGQPTTVSLSFFSAGYWHNGHYVS